MNQFLHFEKLGIVHGITTKIGGISKGPFAEMNTSFFGDDDRLNVCENIKRALMKINSTAKIIVATEQVHSDSIGIIDDETDFNMFEKVDTSNTALESYSLFIAEGLDGVMTTRADVVLMTFYADCVPILISSEDGQVVGNAHAGWRGTVKGIAGKLSQMMLAAGAENLYAGIGHCAGVCCYEVDEVVANAFRETFTFDEQYKVLFPRGSGKYLLDLKKANEIMLQNSGVLLTQIETNLDCTICMPERYHSHRYSSGKKRGSMSAFIQAIKRD